MHYNLNLGILYCSDDRELVQFVLKRKKAI